jgi:diadenylate cyclase
MPGRRGIEMTAALALVAPGTALRDGLDRVVKAKRGALLVIGDSADVLSICSGGFLMDAEFTPQRLAELCKMDSAIILTADASRIARANVHLVPDPTVFTSETGTRHRTAERVARSLNVPVISVSEDMGVITVYVGDDKHTLEEIPRLLVRGNQALQTLERYKIRLDDAATSLTALEVEDLVTVRDVAAMLQRSETVRRVAEQIQTSIVELGAEAHLIRLQLDELLEDVDDDRELVLLDYLPDDKDERLESALLALASLSTDDLTELRTVAAVLLPGTEEETELIDLDHSLQPRGYRLLDKVPRLSEEVVDRLVERFGSLQKLTRATTADLSQVEGVDPSLALSVKDGLDRLAEHTLLDRFH